MTVLRLSTALSPRDLKILQFVARFKQVSAAHVQLVVFNNLSSTTPCDRALKRLTDRGYLLRIERRLVGGGHGGSGQYVYQLGRSGFYMFFTGRFTPARRINFHTIGITDTFVELRTLERAGLLTLDGMSTEPDCWVVIAGTTLRPDLRLDVTRGTGPLKAWFEVDMGSEGQKQLRAKLRSYYRAYTGADVEEWPVFPLVIFVAIDAERERELRWLVSQEPADAQSLFRVCRFDSLAEGLGLTFPQPQG